MADLNANEHAFKLLAGESIAGAAASYLRGQLELGSAATKTSSGGGASGVDNGKVPLFGVLGGLTATDTFTLLDSISSFSATINVPLAGLGADVMYELPSFSGLLIAENSSGVVPVSSLEATGSVTAETFFETLDDLGIVTTSTALTVASRQKIEVDGSISITMPSASACSSIILFMVITDTWTVLFPTVNFGGDAPDTTAGAANDLYIISLVSDGTGFYGSYKHFPA